MISNYAEFKEFLDKVEGKPKLLLHACCAPCSTHVLMLLKDHFDITIFYSNDNIWPVSEFDLRLNEIVKFAELFNIKVVSDGFEPDNFYKAVKGYEKFGEKSVRCYKCYEMRLEKTVQKAKELGFEYFTTTLSISPYKVDKWINKIGYKLQDKYNMKYLYSEFKAENGYGHSLEMCDKYGLYQQDYCGCKYSYEETHPGQDYRTK